MSLLPQKMQLKKETEEYREEVIIEERKTFKKTSGSEARIVGRNQVPDSDSGSSSGAVIRQVYKRSHSYASGSGTGTNGNNPKHTSSKVYSFSRSSRSGGSSGTGDSATESRSGSIVVILSGEGYGKSGSDSKVSKRLHKH